MKRGPRRPAALVALVLALVCACAEPEPQDNDFAWGRSAGGHGDDVARAVSVAADDSIFVTGTVEGTATFGAAEAKEVALTSYDATDAFIAKYRPDGTLCWARLIGGAGADSGNGVAATSDGGVIVTGSIATSVTLTVGEEPVTLVSAGGDDIFIAKLDGDGELLWLRRAGGFDNDVGHDVAATPSGGAFVTGEFQREASFPDGAPQDQSIDYFGASDIFVASYDAFGRVQWLQRAGGNGMNSGNAIAVAADGSALVTGEFRQKAHFGLGEANPASVTAMSGADIFVAKYRPDGSFAWVRRAGSSTSDDISDDVGWDIAGTPDNGMFVTGEFGSSATFGVGEPNQATLVATGMDAAFVVKLDAWGRTLWAQGSAGTLSDVGTGVAVSASGGALITGRFHRNTVFAGNGGSGIALVSEGPNDIFLAEYDDSGRLAWAERAGGYSADDVGYGIAVASDGSVVVSGTFSDRAIFGERTPYCPSLESVGQRDIFVARRQP
jgi:hypothetical protein